MHIKNPFRNKVRCTFCDDEHGFLHSVHGHGVYANDLGYRIFYHPMCLNNVMCNPESNNTKDVDQALNIMELKSVNESYNKEKIIKQDNKISRLKTLCEEQNGES